MVQTIARGGCRVVLTAPSNAAVANLALKIHSSSHFRMEHTVVFGQNCDESVRFLNPYHRGIEFNKFMKVYTRLTDDAKRDAARNKFASWLKLDSNCTTIEDLARRCPYINLDEKSGRGLFDTLLSSATVIFCTLNSSGSNMLRNAVGRDFSTLILDEAGQCPESGEQHLPLHLIISLHA